MTGMLPNLGSIAHSRRTSSLTLSCGQSTSQPHRFLIEGSLCSTISDCHF